VSLQRPSRSVGKKGKVNAVIEAVIFDMDGLLVDSEPVWDAARRWMAREAGKTWTTEDHQAVMGVSTHEWVAYMTDRLALTLPPEEVEERIIERMVEMYRSGIPWFPGAVEAVDLVGGRYRTALASGSHRRLIEAVTADAAMQGRFQVIVASDEVGRGKPAPDVYLAAAERLGVGADDCVCLEDSGNGILAGVRAGMTVIAVPDPRFPPDAEVLGRAHLVLGSLAELSLEHIERLGGV
jgi:beta-phosphoglucomutase-like phosphatase (HAD superfamily)